MKKNSNRSSHHSYLEFIDHFERRLSDHKVNKRDKGFPSAASLPGLSNLLNSFSTIPGSKPGMKSTREEWNPISQRIYIVRLDQSDIKTLVNDFKNSQSAIDRFISVSHEANHILLFEPFFVGKTKKMTQQKFIEHSMIFEGYCFWYADIIVTRRLREKFKDGEFVRSRSALSSPFFHPYRAFQSLGIKNELDILDIYLEAFNGEKTVLHSKLDKAFVGDLFERFGQIYIFNRKPMQRLKQNLDHFDIFDSFQNRFCLPNLPSLLPEEILKVENPQKFCKLVFTKGLQHIESMKISEVLRVRQRRSIQVRAYVAYSLLHVIRNTQFFSLKNKKVNTSSVLLEINSYIDKLEESLQQLLSSKSISAVQKLCIKNDQEYSENIRKTFMGAELWMKNREFIFPQKFAIPFGLIEESVQPTKNQIEKINTEILRICSPIFGNGFKKTKNKQKLAKETFSFFRNFILEPNFYKHQTHLKSWRKSVKSLLSHPDVLPKWSHRLSDIDPTNNSFVELLFEFE